MKTRSSSRGEKITSNQADKRASKNDAVVATDQSEEKERKTNNSNRDPRTITTKSNARTTKTKQAVRQPSTSLTKTTQRQAPARISETKVVTKRKQTEQQDIIQSVPKRVRRELIDFESNKPDPVIDHLRDSIKRSNEVSDWQRQLSIDSEILNQIALEGLNGITLGRLFRLLDATFQPNLNCTKDENCQNYVWSVLVNRYLHYPSDSGVQAYYLDPKAQQSVMAVSENPKGVFVDKVIRLPNQTVKQFAKIHSFLYPVQDGPIMGSCYNYLVRLNVTQILIDKSEKEGILNSMYHIDDQFGLDNVLFVAGQTLRSKTILPNWADPNIDIKLREYCTLELIGKSRTLGTVFPKDKTLGRYRIMLLAKGFITQFQRTNSCPIEHHLKRFSYLARLSSSSDKDGHSTTSETFKSSNCNEKEGNNIQSVKNLCCKHNKLKADRSTLTMVYDVIALSNGCTQLDIRRKLNLPKFHLRNHLKNLISLKMIYSRDSEDSESPFRIYKSAHRSLRRKTNHKNSKDILLVKPRTGIMASWDETDIKAKKIIGHKRSSFSQAEDSLLILCRIASILIDPSIRLSWCVHKRLVRDILHNELLESHDKTSDACLRRIKYLRRLPNNIMSINELTAELRDDDEIRRLIQSTKGSNGLINTQPLENDEKLNKLFLQILKTIRSKIPNLLGITTTTGAGTGSASGIFNITNAVSCVDNNIISLRRVGKSRLRDTSRQLMDGTPNGNQINVGASDCVVRDSYSPIEIRNHEELCDKYELVDCQTVASIQRAPTYEKAKNVVDVKFNNASLVTMAYTLSNCLNGQKEFACSPNSTVSAATNNNEIEQQYQLERDAYRKRVSQWLLDKFYSSYHDKLISSVLSKLNKRSLLTRKCSADQATLYKPKTKMSLKLNQSVIFLLNRCQSSSLMQLAHPISQLYRVDLSESNEMSSIALLTSLCSMSSFKLDLELKIPTNVVGIDQGNENFRSLCEKSNESTREILARFMSRCGGSLTATTPASLEPKPESKLVAKPKSTGSGIGAGASLKGDHQQTEASGSSSVNCAGLVATGNDKHVLPMTEEAQAENATVTTNTTTFSSNNKMDDSRRALFLLRHELKAHALDKCGSLSDCLIVQPCNVKFHSEKQIEPNKMPIEAFLDSAKPLEFQTKVADKESMHWQKQQANDNWLVRGFRLASGSEKELITERDFERNKIPVEYYARLWKSIDGTVHMKTLFKLIESLLSWIIVNPGVEDSLLKREFSHMMPDEHLFELLNLMEQLELISSHQIVWRARPRLFGTSNDAEENAQHKRRQRGACGETGSAPSTYYEATAKAYIYYCQLLKCYCT